MKANQSTSDVPVIFITAKDGTASLVEGFQVGGVDYITKPFQHEEVAIKGLPLGLMETEKYELTKFQLVNSDALISMSDGLLERLNDKDEILGDARLVAEIEKAGETQQNAEGILEALVKCGDDWANNIPQNDDVTLLVLKVK